MLQLHLHAIEPKVETALRRRFADHNAVTVSGKSITTTDAQAIATAGNSFGDMGGGVDKVIDDFFDQAAQPLVMSRIQGHYYGELPVGWATCVQPRDQGPKLIYAPTMRTPGRIKGTINVYLAMRAILITAIENGLESVACPSLGTGTGALTPDEAALQMEVAFRQIVLRQFESTRHAAQAPFLMST